MKTECTKISVKIPTGTIKEWKKRLDNYGEKTACAEFTGISRQTIQQVLKKGSGLRETIEGIANYVKS